eukprot:2946664-Rhodomonas_salina.2
MPCRGPRVARCGHARGRRSRASAQSGHVRPPLLSSPSTSPAVAPYLTRPRTLYTAYARAVPDTIAATPWQYRTWRRTE